jgi:hypothetical protein
VSERVTWHRHFFYRKESWRTTWKFKVSLLGLIALVTILSRVFLAKPVAESLICAEHAPPSDALLLENFDPDYLLFERARALRNAGVSSRIVVPASVGLEEDVNSSVAKGFVDVMSRIARIPDTEVIPFHPKEPISLNAAREIRDFLIERHIKSVIVVSPGFRSRRSELVYGTVLRPAGIAVGCIPVFGGRLPGNWTDTWHGVQEVAEQFAKLQYYRFHVLR